MKLLVEAGEHCQGILDRLCDLPCSTIEADEICTYVRKKQGHLEPKDLDDPEAGDQYTFIGLDPKSKLIAAHAIGRRDAETTTTFIEQLHERVPGRLRLFIDGLPEYLPALDGIYGCENVDYAQVIKPPDGGGQQVARRLGKPGHASTSLVERHNAMMRQQLRRSLGRPSASRRSYGTSARPLRYTSCSTTGSGSTARGTA